MIRSLLNVGVKVRSLVLDGHRCNFSMMSKLCADVCSSDFTRWFVVDDSAPIYVFPDPPHMLKILRNILASCQKFLSSNGDIQWVYIEMLEKLQDRLCLRLGNKLSSTHVRFHNQKMKVKLAAQLFSSSVSKSLVCLQVCGERGFENCSPTAEFFSV